MEFISLAITSLGLGLLHGLDADHIAAVSAFVSKDPSPRNAAIFGFKFGIGHSIPFLTFAMLAIGLMWSIPENLGGPMWIFGGFVLLLLGIWVIKDINREDNTMIIKDKHIYKHGPTAVGVGIGLAGTAGIMLFGPVMMASSLIEAVLLILIYGGGFVFTMGILGLIISRFYQFSYRNKKTEKVLKGLTGAASIIFGIFVIVNESFELLVV